MTKLGRAGAALTLAAVGSFVGGTIATIGLVAAAKPLGELGLLVGPPEFFALMVVGISLLVALAGKSMVKALISGALGLLISMVGIDPVAGAPRFTFGMDRLLDGVSFVAVIVGVFGLSEILSYRKNAETPLVHAPGMRSLLPTADGMAPQRPGHGPRHRRRLRTRPHPRHDRIGVLPAVLRRRKEVLPLPPRTRQGRRRRRGRSGNGQQRPRQRRPDPALHPRHPGIPDHRRADGRVPPAGPDPGPALFTEHSDIAWAIIASLFIGNVLLLLLNVPLVGLWTSILRVPTPILTALILLFMVIGAYTINFSVFDVFVMIGFGLLGLALRNLDIPLAPMVLTLVLGPLMERSLRESLEISQGDFSVFTSRPISAVLIGLGVLIICSPLLKFRKPKALTEDPEA